MTKHSIIFILALMMATGCKHKMEQAKVTSEQDNRIPLQVAGNYTDESYAKRNEGYDWVAVSVKSTSDSTIHISVRSRADKKKPTCTFDANAGKINDSSYTAVSEGKNILFRFTENSVQISAEKEEDKGILNYFCSGGGTLEGTYIKTSEPLDEKQIDPTIFSKILFLQNIGFEVKTIAKGGKQQLSIQPFGLKTDNSKIQMDVNGSVTGAEIEDLNADGFPEVLVYTASAGRDAYGNVIGYSVNNGKSISQIAFPDIKENADAGKGYRGHDEFAIVENSLVQRFKTYTSGDANGTPTGNIRQIQFKLKDGEASRKFVVVNSTEFSEK